MNFKNNIKIFLLIISMVLTSCIKEPVTNKPNQKVESQQRRPDQIVSHFESEFIDSNFTKAKVKADIAESYFETNETILRQNVFVEFFSKKSGKRVSYLTADSCHIDERTKQMIAYGKQVKLISDSTKSSLTTTVLEWNNNSQRITTDKFFNFNNPQEVLNGYGFESDQYLQNYVIKRVSGQRLKSQESTPNDLDLK